MTMQRDRSALTQRDDTELIPFSQQNKCNCIRNLFCMEVQICVHCTSYLIHWFRCLYCLFKTMLNPPFGYTTFRYMHGVSLLNFLRIKWSINEYGVISTKQIICWKLEGCIHRGSGKNSPRNAKRAPKSHKRAPTNLHIVQCKRN